MKSKFVSRMQNCFSLKTDFIFIFCTPIVSSDPNKY